jgi:ubiquitin C-terminal hydrolase
MKASKINAEVTDLEFLSLDFESSERTTTREQYSLHAIIDHVGASQRSGHYISYARRINHLGRLEWFKFDDSVFTQVTRAEVLSSSRYTSEGIPHTPYILLYQRQQNAAVTSATQSLAKRIKHGN